MWKIKIQHLDIIAAGGAIAINPTTTGRGTHSLQLNLMKIKLYLKELHLEVL